MAYGSDDIFHFSDDSMDEDIQVQRGAKRPAVDRREPKRGPRFVPPEADRRAGKSDICPSRINKFDTCLDDAPSKVLEALGDVGYDTLEDFMVQAKMKFSQLHQLLQDTVDREGAQAARSILIDGGMHSTWAATLVNVIAPPPT